MDNKHKTREQLISDCNNLADRYGVLQKENNGMNMYIHELQQKEKLLDSAEKRILDLESDMSKIEVEMIFVGVAIEAPVQNENRGFPIREQAPEYKYTFSSIEKIDPTKGRFFVEIQKPESLSEFREKHELTEEQLTEWLSKNYKE